MDECKDHFNQRVREVMLQRANRLVNLLEMNAPANIICNEISLLQLDLPVFNTNYKQFLVESAEKQIAKIKNRYGVCCETDCYKPIADPKDTSGASFCADCNLEYEKMMSRSNYKFS